MPKEKINKYVHIIFNAIFLAFTAFGLYLSFCDAYKYRGDYGKMLFTSLVFSFLACMLWTNNTIWYNVGKLAVNLILVTVIIRNYARIESEFGILYDYIKRQYYIYQGIGTVPVNKLKSSVRIFGFIINERLALVLVVFLIITIMALAVLRLKWYFLLMLPVVSVIGMEMLHGKAPSVKASFFLATGILGLLFSIKLEVCGGRRNFWQDRHLPGKMAGRYILFIIIITACFLVSLIAEKATKKDIFACSGKVLEKQHKMEKDVAALAENVRRHISNGEDGYLDNKSPDRTGRSVFRIETDKKPLHNIYIKNFSKDIYENGRWISFSGEEPPVSEADIELATYSSLETCIDMKKNIAASLDWTDELDNFNMDIIQDWKFIGQNTLTPYMYNINGEGYQFNCYNMQNWLVQYILSMYDSEMMYYGINDQKEYTSFVYNTYLQVPQGLSKLKDYARKVIVGDGIGFNCVSVKNAICEDTRYSQNLKDVPAGQDYIEYFLFEQKKGYCEHYATTGTILLRLGGIPARYVSGYFIRPSEFNIEYDGAGNEKYVANVSDYNAHAWTEVYKEGFGWLPFDMTNTILDDEYTEDEDIQAGVEDIQQDFTQDMAGSDEDKEDTSSKKDLEEEQDLQEDIEEITNSSNASGKDNKTRNLIKIPKKTLLIVVVLLIVFSPFIYIRIRFMCITRKTNNEGKSNNRVILYFNLLNNYLEFCGFRGISKLEDTEYVRKISGILPEGASLEACMILQCAVFSNTNISSEDEKEVLLFVRNVSGNAYKRCNGFLRLAVYILTGRKEINVFTKVYN